MPETVVRGPGTRRRAAGPALLVAVAAVFALAACSAASTPAAGPSVTTAPPTSQTPTPTPTPTVQRSLLSGRVGVADHAVLAVKLDNTPQSNPWSGLKAADVVYLEQVEGGLSRYMAIYSSTYPTTVGPIRSARISDIDLLRQYGKVAFAYSGVQTKMLPVLKKAYLIDVSDDHGGLGYHRDFKRPAPYNLFGSPTVLLKRAGHAATAVDVGFTFDDTVPAGGTPVTKVSASFPATRVGFGWSPAAGRFLASMNGRKAMATEGGQLGGTTVIIQYVTVTRSIYHDHLGNYTPLSTTVGTGGALILRNGQYWRATWSRPSAATGTHWLVGGQPFPLAGGQVWVLLIDRRTPAKIG
ncbi:MAG: DUF3048 domain-containing protein [Actinomycetes bacterium]